MTTKKSKISFSIQTKLNNHFDPSSGKIDKIDILDISHALSNLCRYAGHCRSFYSVAEHSVLVYRIIKELWPEDQHSQWAGLLHDATEAYVGDVTTPLKILLPNYEHIEDKLAKKISKKFLIKWTKTIQTRVKTADLIALATEATLLFENVSHWSAIRGCKPMPHLLVKKFPIDPKAASKLFLRTFNKLKATRSKKK